MRAGLLVIADGKRGDVPVSAAAYAQALFGSTPTPWGDVAGLGADAATVNPLLGGDALEPLIDGAAEAGAGLFALVRTSNPGAADLFDVAGTRTALCTSGRRLCSPNGRLGWRVPRDSPGSAPSSARPSRGISARIRELMPTRSSCCPESARRAASAAELGDAFRNHSAGAIVTASRSIAGADDPVGRRRRDSASRFGKSLAKRDLTPDAPALAPVRSSLNVPAPNPCLGLIPDPTAPPEHRRSAHSRSRAGGLRSSPCC